MKLKEELFQLPVTEYWWNRYARYTQKGSRNQIGRKQEPRVMQQSLVGQANLPPSLIFTLSFMFYARFSHPQFPHWILTPPPPSHNLLHGQAFWKFDQRSPNRNMQAEMGSRAS